MTQQTPHIQDHEHEPDLNDSEVRETPSGPDVTKSS